MKPLFDALTRSGLRYSMAAAEHDALHELGVTKVQGYHISQPLPLAAAMAITRLHNT